MSSEAPIPVLPGWVTITEAADRIKVSRQHSWRMAKSLKWQSVHRIGNSDVYVVSEAEVQEKEALRG